MCVCGPVFSYWNLTLGFESYEQFFLSFFSRGEHQRGTDSNIIVENQEHMTSFSVSSVYYISNL